LTCNAFPLLLKELEFNLKLAFVGFGARVASSAATSLSQLWEILS